jgi:hypothetical protein
LASTPCVIGTAEFTATESVLFAVSLLFRMVMVVVLVAFPVHRSPFLPCFIVIETRGPISGPNIDLLLEKCRIWI